MVQICFHDFYKKVVQEDKGFFTSELTLEEKLYNIVLDHLGNIKMLYYLYRIMQTIHNIFLAQSSKLPCALIIESVKKCEERYKESIVYCCKGCKIFFYSFKALQGEYGKFFRENDNFIGKCQYIQSTELQGYDSVLEECKKGKIISITVRVLLIPICGFFFKLLYVNMVTKLYILFLILNTIS